MQRLFTQVAGIALTMIATTVMAVDEVKFQKVSSTVASKYGQQSQSINFEAIVKNLAFAKQVSVQLNTGNGTWINVPLSFNRSISGGREVWKTAYQPATNTVFDAVFALKYVVNGQTYWDNNGGANFSIAKDSGSILANGVNVYHSHYAPTATLSTGSTSYSLIATVRNLAPTKNVRVHYSTNNWATTQIANGEFSSYFWAGAYSQATNPNAYGFEEWRIFLPIGNANQVVYAIESVVNGQSHWDNNFGQDYRVAFTRQ